MCERGRRSLALVAALALSAFVFAHDFSQSESTIEIDGPGGPGNNIVRVRLSLNLLELPDVDASRDGRVSYDELEEVIERVVALVKEHYTVGAPDPPTRTVVDRHEIVDDHVLRLDIRYAFGHDVKRVDLASTLDALLGPTHQHFLTARINGELRRAVLDATNRTAHFDASRVTLGRLAAVGLALLGLGLLAAYRMRPSHVR